MSSFRQKGIIFFFLVFIVGCNPFESVGLLGKRSADGTSDTGGGNGLDGKVYEAYIVNPESLQAYREYLKPLMDAITAKEEQTEAGTDSSWRWVNFLRSKTFYLAPVDLQNISKEVLGVSFAENKSDQLAIQTKNEIWIDSRLFEKMSTYEQAQLLLHEYVMLLYFLKYKSMSELCYISLATASDRSQCRYVVEWGFDEIMPAEMPVPLNPVDYQNIRHVTGFLKTQGAQSSIPEIVSTMKRNGFDSRLFADFRKVGSGSGGHTNVISTEVVSKLLKSAQVLDQIPEDCYGSISKAKEDCRWSFRERMGTHPFEQKSIPVVDVKLSLLKNGKSVDVFAETMMMTQIHGISYDGDLLTDEAYEQLLFFPMPFRFGEIQLGRQAHAISVYARLGRAPSTSYQMLGVSTIPLRVVSVSGEGMHTNCRVGIPSMTGVETERWVSTLPLVRPEFLMWKSKFFPVALPPLPCAIDN